MSLIRKHGAVLQAWACLDLVFFCSLSSKISSVFSENCIFWTCISSQSERCLYCWMACYITGISSLH